MHPDKILVLDFGSQYTQLIARRVRELGVYCELHPYDVSDAFLAEFAPSGIILSGGPASVYDGDTPRVTDNVFMSGVPVLGVCYGMQAMAAQLGGGVETSKVREFGYAEIRARGHSKLLEGIEDRNNAEGHGLLDVWMSHGDEVTRVPDGFKVIASNAATPIAGMADEAHRLYGLQFHPEVTHTLQGKAILERFVRSVGAAAAEWYTPALLDAVVGRTRSGVGCTRSLLQVFRFSASVTACRQWRRNWAGVLRPRRFVNSGTRKFAQEAIQSCLRVLRIATMPTGMVCWTCG